MALAHDEAVQELVNQLINLHKRFHIVSVHREETERNPIIHAEEELQLSVSLTQRAFVVSKAELLTRDVIQRLVTEQQRELVTFLQDNHCAQSWVIASPAPTETIIMQYFKCPL